MYIDCFYTNLGATLPCLLIFISSPAELDHDRPATARLALKAGSCYFRWTRMDANAKTHKQVTCFHCGDECRDTALHDHGKYLCCEGCRLVYGIINENGLCNYY